VIILQLELVAVVVAHGEVVQITKKVVMVVLHH
jgi:hypothetical protein